MPRRMDKFGTIGVAALCAAAGLSRADIDPLSGIDFATITAPGNAPWAGDGRPVDQAIGRGGVGYEYRIGKFEVTTAQWAEFMNAAFDRPQSDWIPHTQFPGFWGATPVVPTTPGGRRWAVPAGNEMRGVGNISWRHAAIYCNWLHNNKSLDRAAFLTGAYDVSTFYENPGGRFYDQLTRSPGARYYIPSWDEWLKAAHYDPNKVNSDGSVGGWWSYSNGTNQAFIPGPPGAIVNGQLATANFGWSGTQYPGQNPFNVPLGSYAVTSPYGLYDVAGMATEWVEEPFFFAGEPIPIDRYYEGSHWLQAAGDFRTDTISLAQGAEPPWLSTFNHGIRIAAAIPAPGTALLSAGIVGVRALRRRRKS
jgi:formylglycine-generating enzyme required for sulfatase activity